MADADVATQLHALERVLRASTWPTTATSVGVRIEDRAMAVCAPFGLRDVFAMVARPNKTLITREIYEEKVQRWLTAWPRLTVMEWDS